MSECLQIVTFVVHSTVAETRDSEALLRSRADAIRAIQDYVAEAMGKLPENHVYSLVLGTRDATEDV
jgi:hypothetical protein